MVEACYRSIQCEVHEEEFPHLLLQFLPAHMALRGRDEEELKELQVFLLCEGDRALLCVDQPTQYLLNVGPIALICHHIFDADRVLGFSGQGQKNPF